MHTQAPSRAHRHCHSAPPGEGALTRPVVSRRLHRRHRRRRRRHCRFERRAFVLRAWQVTPPKHTQRTPSLPRARPFILSQCPDHTRPPPPVGACPLDGGADPPFEKPPDGRHGHPAARRASALLREVALAVAGGERGATADEALAARSPPPLPLPPRHRRPAREARAPAPLGMTRGRAAVAAPPPFPPPLAPRLPPPRPSSFPAQSRRGLCRGAAGGPPPPPLSAAAPPCPLDPHATPTPPVAPCWRAPHPFPTRSLPPPPAQQRPRGRGSNSVHGGGGSAAMQPTWPTGVGAAAVPSQAHFPECPLFPLCGVPTRRCIYAPRCSQSTQGCSYLDTSWCRRWHMSH